MKKIILLFTIISIGNNICLAQTGQQDSWANTPDFAPKSPEAKEFEKYGNYNVNLAKGLVNISVPLYTLEAGDYKLPIELNYNPSGIKINQDATWVGLGWNMQAGAQITLSIRDSPDETVDIPMPASSEVNTYLSTAEPWDYCQPYMNTLRTNSWIKDVYHFSSPTAQGKFVLGDAQGENNIHIYPPDAFTVETEGSKNARRFKIKDTQGNIYFFNTTREISRSVGIQHDTNYYTTAWYVDQIKTPSNNVIDFAYTNDGWHAQMNVNDQITVTDVINDCDPGAFNTQILNASVPRNSRSATKTFKLSSISFKDRRILFVPQTGRLDLVAPSLLDQARFPTENVAPSYLRFVKIQNNTNGTYNDIKAYELFYNYFDAGGTELEYYRKRLKLVAVTDIIDENISTSFTYSDIKLPPKNSRQSDAWGYCNGAANLTLVPPQHVYINNAMVTLGSANRNVNINNVKAGMLTEIKYPTKGKTKFNYESNQYFGSDELNKSREIIINSHYVQGVGMPEGNLEENCPGECTVIHEIPYNITGTATARLTFETAYTGAGILTMNKYQYARVSIYNSSSTLIYDSGKRKSSIPFDTSVNLTGAGTIIIEAYGQYMGVKNFQCKYINYDPTPKNVVGPGLRIASIENYTDDTTLATKKQYTYSIPDQNDKSSGKLIFDAVRKFEGERFGTLERIICPPASPGESPPLGVFWKQNITNVYSGQSAYFLMNEIYYTDVKEEDINIITGAKNGYTAYNYDFMQCSASQEGSINIEYDWLRGNLLSKKVYNSNNKIVLEEVNNYVEDPAKTAVVAGFKLYFRYTFITCPTIDSSTHVFPFENMGYSYTIPWRYLKSKNITETMYNASNVVSGTVVTNTTYNYSNPVHMQLSSQTITSSKGETVETKYFYPGDTDLASEPLVTTLLTANRFAPVKMQTFVNTTKISESKKLFKDWGNGMIQPEIIQTAKGTASLENRLKIIQIDNTNGNILQQRQENGVDVTYIWGYNGMNPIAKIENATYLQVKTALGITDDALKALTTMPSNIRTLLPNAFITTYTYLPGFGINSMTDSKGLVTTYEYDGQGHLTLVKEGNKIISENQYYYRLN